MSLWRINEPYHTWMRHGEIVMPHMNEPHDIRMSHMTYERDMSHIWMSEAIVCCHMRLQWLSGSLNWQVSCAKEPFKSRTLLRKTLVYFVVLYTSSTQWSSSFLQRVLFIQGSYAKGPWKNRALFQKETGPYCGVLQPLHKPSMQQYICIFINTYMYICICTHSYIYIDYKLVWGAFSAPKNGPIFFGRGSCFFYTPSTELFGALTALSQNTIFTKCVCLWKRVLLLLLAANAKSIKS